jgi:FkbM family methyltransferase
MRRFLRVLARASIRMSPESVRRVVARIPFSRFHGIVGRLVKGEAMIEWNGIRIIVDPSETGGFFLYFFDKCLAPEAFEINAISAACLKLRGPFLDVGANCGLLSLAVAARAPDIDVFGFEIDPTVLQRFARNLALNSSIRRLEIVPVAASVKAGTARFLPGAADAPETGRLVGDSERVIGVTHVSTIDLDTFCQDRRLRPAVMKIDVEGHELEVLRGMAGLLAAGWPRTLLLEAHAFAHPRAESFWGELFAILGGTYSDVLVWRGAAWRDARTIVNWGDREHLLLHR